MRETVAGLLLALGILAGGSLLPERVNDPQLSNRELRVATNSGWVPQSFLDDHNQLIGFDIDVSHEIGRRLGMKVVFETPEFSAMTGGHWHGRWDMAVGSVTPTKARAQVVDFAGIYYYSPYVFAVNKSSAASSIADLNGKQIGVETGTTSEDYIRRRLQIDAPDAPPVRYLVTPGAVHTYADSMLPFDDLRLGDGVRIDAVIAPEQTVLRAIQNGYPIRILPGYAFREPLTVVTDKGNPKWTAKVAGIIADMKADGTLAQLTTKWYGKDYSH
ncbi:MAG: transporter substrate-binding domain-containing protein [Steroidobacteraceae bacterium]